MRVRKPAVAGYFYPSDRKSLEEYADKFTQGTTKIEGDLRGLIAPHAGYECSGSTAGKAYSLLKGKGYKRVLLIGPSHHVDFYGYSFGSFEAFETPLGIVKVDTSAIREFSKKEEHFWDMPHLWEHSLEVHLPFLQKLLGDFLLIPLVYGRVKGEDIRELLEYFSSEDTLFVISSDLSHYYPDEVARRMDSHCHSWIVNMDESHKKGCEACGKKGIEGALLYAEDKGLKRWLIGYKTSAETCSDDKRVVGYGAYAFTS
ncbi:MAG: AmmeMemoRadiSam system protein B [Aquificaceae bacterium]